MKTKYSFASNVARVAREAFARGARRYIRKAYAIHYSLLGDDGMTYSHLHL